MLLPHYWSGFTLTTDRARVLENGSERFVAIDNLQIGDLVIVKPGELIPIDAAIAEGTSSLNQAPITGESIPVEKTIGDEVFAGSINSFGALKLKVDRPSVRRSYKRLKIDNYL